MWVWHRTERLVGLSIKEVLCKVKEERSLMATIRVRQRKWIGFEREFLLELSWREVTMRERCRWELLD